MTFYEIIDVANYGRFLDTVIFKNYEEANKCFDKIFRSKQIFSNEELKYNNIGRNRCIYVIDTNDNTVRWRLELIRHSDLGFKSIR